MYINLSCWKYFVVKKYKLGRMLSIPFPSGLLLLLIYTGPILRRFPTSSSPKWWSRWHRHRAVRWKIYIRLGYPRRTSRKRQSMLRQCFPTPEAKGINYYLHLNIYTNQYYEPSCKTLIKLTIDLLRINCGMHASTNMRSRKKGHSRGHATILSNPDVCSGGFLTPINNN